MKEPVRYVKDGLIRYDWPDKEWLEYQYVTLGKNALQLSEEVGCDGHAIALWLSRAGIRVRPRGESRRKYPQLCNAEWLRHQYVTLGKSSGQIQRDLGIPHLATVIQWLHRNGIEIRSEAERGKRHSEKVSGSRSPAWNGGTSQGYQKRKLRKSVPDETCAWCGSTENVQIHHIDHDRANADPRNLMWLCNHCNLLEASLYHLSNKGRATVIKTADGLTIRFTSNMCGGTQ